MNSLEEKLRIFEEYLIQNARTIIWIGIGIIILMVLFPPWVFQVYLQGRGSFRENRGYGFIFSPPDNGFNISIDFSLLLTQTIPIAIFIFYVIYLQSKRIEKND